AGLAFKRRSVDRKCGSQPHPGFAGRMAVPSQPQTPELHGPCPMKRLTPKSLGYRMPAEWEDQEAIWLTWPHNQLTWPDGMLAEVERSYVEIVRALYTGQKIKLLVRDSESEGRVRLALEREDIALTQVDFILQGTEDS